MWICTSRTPSGQTAWYAGRSTPSGVVLDFDDTDGFGPEHISVQRVPGAEPLPGEYVISVHYFSDDGTTAGAAGLVTIVLNEGTEDQALLELPFTIASSNGGNATPGSSGPDWVRIARVDVVNGVITPE